MPSPKDLNEKKVSSSRASGHVQSLSRALSLLNALSEHNQGLSLSAVAHEVGLPTSTAHRLLTTLQNERYVRFDADHSAFHTLDHARPISSMVCLSCGCARSLSASVEACVRQGPGTA